jgi:hypothetical protein
MEPKNTTDKSLAPNEQRVGPERKSVAGFAHRFRPTYAAANVGYPCGSVGPSTGLRGRPAVSHISRKTSEMPRISCTQLWTGPRVRLSLRKGACSSGNPRSSTGNRRCGAPGDGGGIEPKSATGQDDRSSERNCEILAGECPFCDGLDDYFLNGARLHCSGENNEISVHGVG